MSHIVETSEEDSWLAVANYIGELIDAGQVRLIEQRNQKVMRRPFSGALVRVCIRNAPYVGFLQEEASKLIETPGSRFAEQCKAAYEAKNYAELLEHFAANIDVLYSKASSEQGTRFRSTEHEIMCAK
jgi:hypothetical protein